MANVRCRSLIEIDLGSETVRLEQDHLKGNLSQKFDVMQLLADDAADGDVTLWDQAVHKPTNSTGNLGLVVLLVDPEDGKTSVLDLAVQLTAAGSTIRVTANRVAPLVLTSDVSGSALNTMTGKLTKIEVRNNNAAPATGNNDLLARLLILK